MCLVQTIVPIFAACSKTLASPYYIVECAQVQTIVELCWGYKPLCLILQLVQKNFGLTFNLLPSQFITGHGHSRLSVPSTFHNTISTGLRTKYIHKAFAGTSLFPPPEVLLHTHNSQALAES